MPRINAYVFSNRGDVHVHDDDACVCCNVCRLDIIRRHGSCKSRARDTESVEVLSCLYSDHIHETG